MVPRGRAALRRVRKKDNAGSKERTKPTLGHADTHAGTVSNTRGDWQVGPNPMRTRWRAPIPGSLQLFLDSPISKPPGSKGNPCRCVGPSHRYSGIVYGKFGYDVIL
jgi:hypothetical protein